MSNFRNKASNILERGKAERGNFEPNGVPLRMYNWWLNNSTGEKAIDIKHGKRRENFCHFWRVVAIWVPLIWLGQKTLRFVGHPAGAIFSMALTLAVIVWACMASGNVFSVVVATLVAALGLAALAGIVYGVYRLHKRFWDSSWNHVVQKISIGIFITFVITDIVSLLVIAAMASWWAPFAIIGGVVLFIGILIALGTFVEFISGKRAIAKDADVDRIAQMTDDEYFEYLRVKNAPGRISKFFSGMADFLILVTQVVRVKKWKICPMVDIEVK